ncbi:hypothetical protein DM02DRAFT_617714 [Periconia macrospinosa]|uniref:Uncharacterized protein n=1 Tax=Periconia macrospinosa TaxID=97972 RepID=A0A2V1DF07_9PLEO|nr:hypothetical protein DM02DRAFT_617714 [Periconia macrospinosa]
MPSIAINPRVLLVSLDPSSWFERMAEDLLDKLETAATLEQAADPDSAIEAVTEQPLPHAVLVTDGNIIKHRGVYAKLLDYVRGGGTLVFMGCFPGEINPEDLNDLLREAGLPWEMEGYYRVTVHRNDTEETAPHTSLLSSYSQKAVFLRNVDRKDAWYRLGESSRTESLVFAPVELGDKDQTPIAMTRIGEGKFGYVGDINGEEGSDRVILAMCGLRDSEYRRNSTSREPTILATFTYGTASP